MDTAQPKVKQRYLMWREEIRVKRPSIEDAFIAGYRARAADEGLEAAQRLMEQILRPLSRQRGLAR